MFVFPFVAYLKIEILSLYKNIAGGNHLEKYDILYIPLNSWNHFSKTQALNEYATLSNDQIQIGCPIYSKTCARQTAAYIGCVRQGNDNIPISGPIKQKQLIE
jgi:hypothetical protein